MIQKFLGKFGLKYDYLLYGRDIILDWCRNFIDISNHEIYKILDIGCGKGDDLLKIKNGVSDKKLDLYGLEIHRANEKISRKEGIKTILIDIEKDKIPFEDEYFDIIIANQIIEHVKEIFWVFSEISRLVKKEGIVIIGFPNLLSLHNRLIVLLGEQPPTIELLGAHIRGISAPSFKRFVETEGYFKVLEISGSNFYPFPPIFSIPLSKIFPKLSVCLFFLIKRQNKKGNFAEILNSRFYETPFFRGNSQ